MKQLNNYLISFLFVVSAVSAVAQTTIWEENFATGAGWELDDNWAVDNHKLWFNWDPPITGFDLCATGPAFVLPAEADSLRLQQYLCVYNGTDEEFAQICLLHEADTIVLWEHPLINGNWGTNGGSPLSLAVEGLGGQQVRVMFRTYGTTTFNWQQWEIFHVEITGSFQNDVAVTGFEGPKVVSLFETGQWVVEVTNQGAEPIQGFDLQLQDVASGQFVASQSLTVTLQPGESHIAVLEYMPNAARNTTVRAVVENATDDFIVNNRSDVLFLRIPPEESFEVLLWDHDNGIPTIVDPEIGDFVQASEGLRRAFDQAGIPYQMVQVLPADLSGYDMIFATMGSFCVD
ncbi:MAG: hypothetical protein Kow00127_10870 [Bacteroidales bacterium]